MTFQYEINPKWLQEKKIDYSKLDPDFMPGFQKEIEWYKKEAILHNGRDSVTVRFVPDRTWPRDPQPNELPYERWLKEVTDDNMKYNQARDEKGNPVKGTGVRHMQCIYRLNFLIDNICVLFVSNFRMWLF